MQDDFHRLAELVGAFGTFQRGLPAAGLRTDRRWRFHGAIRATLQRPIAIA
jgi:hypothetical protein